MIYTVTELCAKYQTDKGIINTTLDPQTWMHDYSIFYDKIFYPLKYKSIDLLEIGCWGNNNGGSVKMWQEYFANGKIHGIDINQDATELNSIGIQTKIIDCDNENDALESIKEFNTKFDIIIDDASHSNKQQIRNLVNYINFVKNDGVYIIEDCNLNDNLIENITSNALNFNFCEKHEIDKIKSIIKKCYIINTNPVSKLAVFIKKQTTND